VDFDESELLDGLEGEDRQARLKLLERLSEDGAELEELQQAVQEDRLALLPLERVLGGHHTAREVAEQAGIEVEWLLRVRRALGLPEARPDERVFSDDDVMASQALKLLIDGGLPENGLIESTRVLGEGMSRFAATVTAMFAQTFLKRGDSELDVALRYEAMATELTPATEPILAAALSAHLRENTRRAMLGRAQREAGSPETNQEVVVCFADLVGFTALGGQIAAEELGSLAGTLAELAAEVAAEPVRLVKTIGDAAMFVSPQAAPIIAAALALVEAVEEAELPSLRTGLASGSALQRAGDWYGNPVNIASRVTGIARPGSVLCTEDVRNLALEEFVWSYAGRYRIKGVNEQLPLHRARPLESADGDADEPRGGASSQKAGRRRRRASNSGE
jgi:adenylate cyclase